MRYLDELKALDLPRDRYVVFGSGPMAIRGIRENRDIDLILAEDLWDELEDQYPRNENGSLQLAEHVEAFRYWPYVDDPASIISNAEIIDGVPFARLEDVKAWKGSSDDPEDREDVGLIREYDESRSGRRIS